MVQNYQQFLPRLKMVVLYETYEYLPENWDDLFGYGQTVSFRKY